MEVPACSYPDSGDSSPQSGQNDFEKQPTSREEHPPGNSGCKVKFMVRYGGRIQPRPHDNQLSYVGGETKILAVDRTINFLSLLSKLSALCHANVTFKYQLPGEDLDALISVINDDDLEHMMHEYDRLHRGVSRPARLRLFLFPLSYSGQQCGFGPGVDAKSAKVILHEALTSLPVHAVGVSTAQPSTPTPGSENVDFLFGLDKRVEIPATPAIQVHQPIPDLDIQSGVPVFPDKPIVGLDPQFDARIQELNRLQISAQERLAMFPTKIDNNLVGGLAGDSFVQKLPAKITAPAISAAIPQSAAVSAMYCQQEKIIDRGFPATLGVEPQQPAYVISAPAGAYYGPIFQPVRGQGGPGYYMVPPSSTVPAALLPQLPKTAAHTEATGIQMRPVFTAFSQTDSGFTPVAYDSVTGRQVCYSAPARAVATTSYQGATGGKTIAKE
ncbi:hypothetical protein Nepgr_025528 [Nepenthes gracilis]|uniref:PB1 domain-containing protein n=1 Tax=Nepenthes gracilis TaxID=150966 RepID=A0AAD3Y154_NEPGR|nr:hypothetical protein Nepgr_025528 [Nepenthes gracilis]